MAGRRAGEPAINYLPQQHTPPRGLARVQALAKYDVEAAWARWSADTFDAPDALRRRRRRVWQLIWLVALIVLAATTAGVVV